MMKLLVITAFFPPHHAGGYGIRCKEVTDELSKRGHQIIILTNRCIMPNCTIHNDEIRVYRDLHLKGTKPDIINQIKNDISDLRFIENKLNEFNPDIIYLWHIQNFTNSMLSYFSSTKKQIVWDDGGYNVLYFTEIHNQGGYFYNKPYDSFVRKLLKKIVNFFAYVVSSGLINPYWNWPKELQIYYNSQSSFENSSNLGANNKNAKVINSGIQIEKFPYKIRKSIELPLSIIVPSRIKGEKGIADIILLARELTSRNIKVVFTVIGEIQSEEFFSEFAELIHKNQLSDNIQIYPMTDQEELSLLYRENQFCYFPSMFKSGFSRVPLEAMASGCLVISYGNEGSAEYIQNDETGILVSEGNVKEIANNLSKLIERSSDYLRIVKNARKQVESNYSFDSYIDSVESFLLKSIK